MIRTGLLALILVLLLPTLSEASPWWTPPPPDDPMAELYPEIPPRDFWQRSEVLAWLSYRYGQYDATLEDATLLDFSFGVGYRYALLSELGFYAVPFLDGRLILASAVGTTLFLGGGLGFGWKTWLTDWLQIGLEVRASLYGMLGRYSLNANIDVSQASTNQVQFSGQILLPIQLQLGYRHGVFLNPQISFLSPGLIGFGADLGYALQLGAEPPPPPKPIDNSLELVLVEVEALFPNMYPTEGGIPVTVTLTNVGPDPLDEVVLQVALEGLVVRPTELRLAQPLPSGETIQRDIVLNASERYFNITRQTQGLFVIDASYFRRGFDFEKEFQQQVLVHSRNTLTWQDDRVVSVFVNAADPMVSDFVRRVLGRLDSMRYPMLPRKMEQAIKIFTALEAMSFTYVSDPDQPFVNSFGGATVIDTITYPFDMLHQRAGDCDDLSTLYASLLESMGIETAFITVPGHIFMMFNTEVPEGEWEDVSALRDWLHISRGEVWIPVETTAVGRGFMTAWEEAINMLEATPDRLKRVHPTHDAWDQYTPFAAPHEQQVPELPMLSMVERLISDTTDLLIRRELSIRSAPLLEAYSQNPNDVRLLVRLGLEHARWDEPEQSLLYLQDALALQPTSLEASIGMVYSLTELERFDEARDYISHAVEFAPGHPILEHAQGYLEEEERRIEAERAAARELAELEPDAPAAESDES